MFGKNALVVDDSLTARTVLKHQLSQFDVVVESVPDGNHALKMLQSHTPDVIFLDHVMPGLDGFQVLARLKNNDSTKRIPVVMYTSQAAPQYIREAKFLGAVAVIPKNVTDEQLVDALNKAEVYQLKAANDDFNMPREDGETVAGDATPATAKPPEPAPPAGQALPRGAPTAFAGADTTGGKAEESPARGVPRAPAEQHEPSASLRWLVALLLASLFCSQVYLLRRDGEQQRVIGELHRKMAVDEQKMSGIYDQLASQHNQRWVMGALHQQITAEEQKFAEIFTQLEFQQEQLNETNARQVELMMNLLVERAKSDVADDISSN